MGKQVKGTKWNLNILGRYQLDQGEFEKIGHFPGKYGQDGQIADLSKNHGKS